MKLFKEFTNQIIQTTYKPEFLRVCTCFSKDVIKIELNKRINKNPYLLSRNLKKDLD